MVDEAVRPEQIAEVVARWTGVPVAKMLEGEKEKLLRMEEELGKRVIGQRQAVDAVSQRGAARAGGPAGREPSAGLLPVPRPDRRRQDRADQGAGRVPVRRRPGDGADRHVEFMEKHSVARLIGAPPGYVGYDEGGVLTEAVRRGPTR
jgi:ATP-dependent Clp protease ATP-binding subunit ClpB